MKLFMVSMLLTTAAFGQLELFDLENADSAKFENFLTSKAVIVVGEMHGTTQVPSFVLKLIQKLNKPDRVISVGLEIPTDYQSNLDSYLETGDFDKLLALDYFKFADGRTSVAMGELIKGLRKISKVKVVCFDLAFGVNANRDSLMGVNLSKNYSGGQMIILTGNLHANLNEGYWRPNFKSAIFHFNEMSGLGDKLISLNVFYAGGTIWNCIQDGCKERDAGINGGNLKQRYGLTNFVGVYDGVNPSGYSGFVYFDQVTASKPLVSN